MSFFIRILVKKFGFNDSSFRDIQVSKLHDERKAKDLKMLRTWSQASLRTEITILSLKGGILEVHIYDNYTNSEHFQDPKHYLPSQLLLFPSRSLLSRLLLPITLPGSAVPVKRPWLWH